MDFLPPLTEADRQVVAATLGAAPGNVAFAADYTLYQSPVWKAVGESDAALEFQEAYADYRQRGEGTADGLNTLADRVKEDLGEKVGTEAVKGVVTAFEAVLARVLGRRGGPGS